MIYLVRHGETVWNALGRIQGRKDSALTAKGRAQASAIGRLLKTLVGKTPLNAAISPLGRTRETAALIAQEVPLVETLEPRIAEVSLGAWDGMTGFEIEQEYPHLIAGASRATWYFRSPDGEPLSAVVKRVSAWLADAEGPLVAVSHGVAGRVIRGLYCGLSEREMLALDAPQDGLFVLDQGRANFVPAPL